MLYDDDVNNNLQLLKNLLYFYFVMKNHQK